MTWEAPEAVKYIRTMLQATSYVYLDKTVCNHKLALWVAMELDIHCCFWELSQFYEFRATPFDPHGPSHTIIC